MTYLDDDEVVRSANALGNLTTMISDHLDADFSANSRINPDTAGLMLDLIRTVASVLVSRDSMGDPPGLSDVIDQIDEACKKVARTLTNHVPGKPISLYRTDATTTEDRVYNLKLWWSSTAAVEIEMVADKAVTYGSNSIEQVGRKQAQLSGRQVDSEEAQELGCWINAVQKMERWTDAVMRGERPKDDTITDLHTYSVMALRIRNAGGWPDSKGTP